MGIRNVNGARRWPEVAAIVACAGQFIFLGRFAGAEVKEGENKCDNYNVECQIHSH